MRFVQGGLVPMLVGVALAAPVAFAQAPASNMAKPAPATTPAAVQAPARVPLNIARGVVKSVADSRLVIDLGTSSGPGAGPSAFVMDAQTQIQRLGRALTAKDLRVGDAVTVGYQMHGDKAVASRVWLRFGGSTAGAASR
jgi:K+-transporting ATPase c subunit